MHQIKCAGILGWKKVSQLISRHGPDFALFLFIFYWSFQCNFVSFFAGRNAAGCPTEYFLWILNKRPAAGATFQCLDRRQKELIPSIWSPSKNRHYTFKQTHCFVFFSLFTCFLIFLFFEIICWFFLFFDLCFYCISICLFSFISFIWFIVLHLLLFFWIIFCIFYVFILFGLFFYYCFTS